MITEIEIENFRCFEHTKIEGLARVNLIGGKNNSGKTALLEAILLNQSPRLETLWLLQSIRDESEYLQLEKYQDVWNYLFFMENIKKAIVFKSISQKLGIIEIALSIKEDERNSKKDIQKNKWKYRILNNTDPMSGLPYDQIRTIAMLNVKKTITSNSKIIESHKLFIYGSSYGFLYKNNDYNVPKPQYISPRLTINSDFFNKTISSYGLAKGYQELAFHSQKKILNILKIIDYSLEKITMIDHKTPDSPMIYLKRENEEPLPLALFGDAMNRVFKIALNLTKNRSHYLLIDEIENGIHYTNHRDFWKALFQLAKQLDVQIFATTHSLEMIEAFRDIGLLEDYQGDGAYFEMARNLRNDRIVGIKHDLDLLDYELRRNEGVRGE
ncbi:MAG: ATP/GTP-binding protein [Microcystaceae cyanobacterium]